MGNLLDLLKDRYSERRFDPGKELEEEKLELLLEAARLAPTAHNNQFVSLKRRERPVHTFEFQCTRAYSHYRN